MNWPRTLWWTLEFFEILESNILVISYLSREAYCGYIIIYFAYIEIQTYFFDKIYVKSEYIYLLFAIIFVQIHCRWLLYP